MELSLVFCRPGVDVPSLKPESCIAETSKSVQKRSGRPEFRWPATGPVLIRAGYQKRPDPVRVRPVTWLSESSNCAVVRIRMVGTSAT